MLFCMIAMILISMLLMGFLQTLRQYQALHAELELNATVQQALPALQQEAFAQIQALNLHMQNPKPTPSVPPPRSTHQNQINLRSIVIDKGVTIYFWQGWFFMQTQTHPLPITPLFETTVRCIAESTVCQMTSWHRALEST